MKGILPIHNQDTWDTHVALVTGGCSGIGKAIVRQFVALGARVAIVDVARSEAADAFVESLCAAGAMCKLFESDVRSYKDAQLIVEEVVESFGGIHSLVNCAGINRDRAIWNMSEEDWDAVIDVDLKGCFNFSHAVAPWFREQQRGRVVNISSINGMRGKFGQCNYAAAKAGMIGLSKSLARELGPYGVTVNVVAPGFIRTPMTISLDQKWQDAAIEETVLKRAGETEDVAALVGFLCSEVARHITGEVIKVDGGQYL